MAMAAVHEQVHERAKRQERQGVELNHMSLVLSPQKIGCDHPEPGKNHPAAKVQAFRQLRSRDLLVAMVHASVDPSQVAPDYGASRARGDSGWAGGSPYIRGGSSGSAFMRKRATSE